MTNTENIQLPTEGKSITVTIEHNSSLVINNWKDVRYYLTLNYSTQFNKKTRSLGWIAVDGSEDELSSFGGDEVQKIISEIQERAQK